MITNDYTVLMPKERVQNPFWYGNQLTKEQSDIWQDNMKSHFLVTDYAIPLKDLQTLACAPRMDTYGFLLFDYVWASLKFCSRAPGYIAKQWLITNNLLRSVDAIEVTTDMIESFVNASRVRQRVIIIIDDICYGRPSRFFQFGFCSFCQYYRSHHTAVCPLYPTENSRRALLDSEKRCRGCGKHNCIVNLIADHAGVSGFKPCPYCAPVPSRSHVKWRCAATKRAEQNYDVGTRYLISNWATRSWNDEQWVELLQNICVEWDLPFPNCITNEALPNLEDVN